MMFHRCQSPLDQGPPESFLRLFLRCTRPQVDAHECIQQEYLPTRDPLGAEFEVSHFHSELPPLSSRISVAHLGALTTQCLHITWAAERLKPSSIII